MGRFVCLLALVLFSSCNQSNNNLSREENLKRQQYEARGKTLYATHCSNCHGPEANGLAQMYPPLRNADWVTTNADKISCVIKNGISGKLIINNIEFTGEMPGHPDLTDLEIAEITAYLLSRLNEGEEFFDVNEIKKQLEGCVN